MRTWMLILPVLTLGFAACSGDDDPKSDDTAATGDDDDTTGDDDDDTTADPVDAILALSADPSAGMATYDSTCALCHGAKGDGGTGTAFVGSSITLEQSVEAIYYGQGSIMLAYGEGGDLTDQQIADVAAYIDTTFVNP